MDLVQFRCHNSAKIAGSHCFNFPMEITKTQTHTYTLEFNAFKKTVGENAAKLSAPEFTYVIVTVSVYGVANITIVPHTLHHTTHIQMLQPSTIYADLTMMEQQKQVYRFACWIKESVTLDRCMWF